MATNDIAINYDGDGAVMIPVLATIGAHAGENTEHRFVTLWVVISGRRRWPRGGRGAGNHGQVASVTIDCRYGYEIMSVLCVCCVRASTNTIGFLFVFGALIQIQNSLHIMILVPERILCVQRKIYEFLL